jgi:hypothetical protein
MLSRRESTSICQIESTMNESLSVTPRSPAPWVVPVVEELGVLADLTLEVGSPVPGECDLDNPDPDVCGPG